MAHFAAIELWPHEHVEHVLRRFISIAAELGIRFRTLETYGTLSFGGRTFVRFRTDCATYPPIVARYQFEGRAVIVPMRVGYRVYMGRRQGPVRGTVMQVTSAPGFGRVYQGPLHAGWQGQFG